MVASQDAGGPGLRYGVASMWSPLPHSAGLLAGNHEVTSREADDPRPGGPSPPNPRHRLPRAASLGLEHR